MLKRRLASVVLGVYLFITTAAIYGQSDDRLIAITADSVSQIGVLTLLLQHTAPITEMEFSPNASAFITSSLDGTLCIWNIAGRGAAAGKLLFCLLGYNPSVTRYQWSPDERTLAVTSSDGLTIQLFRVDSAIEPQYWVDLRPQMSLPANHAPFLTLVFAAGGASLLAHDVFDTFTLYDTATGEPLSTLEGTASDTDGGTIAVATLNGDIVLVDAETGNILETLVSEGVAHVLFAPDGRQLVTWGTRTQVWALNGRNRRPRTLTRQVDNVQFLPGGDFLATWEGESIRLWNLATDTVTGVMEGHTGGVHSLTFTPNSQRMVSIDSTGRGRLWDIDGEGQVKLRLQFRDNIDRVFMSPDSLSAAVARHDFSARFYDVGRGQLRGQYDLPPDAEFSPDWTLIATRTGRFVVWHGLKNDPRVFDRSPVGFTNQAANIRATPDTRQARVAVLPANTPVFALGRTESGDWLRIILPDGTEGWVFTMNVELAGNLNRLPVVE